MILDKLAVYALGAALAAMTVFSGYAWFVHGHQRYVEGVADEREHWTDVIRKTNRTIDGLASEAELAKRERDAALDLPIQTIRETKFVALPVDVVKQCSYPEPVRKALSAINVKRQP